MIESNYKKVVYLLLGCICLALARGDWPMALPGFLYAYFLLRYTRSKIGFSGGLALFVGIFAAAAVGLQNRNSFFPLPLVIVLTILTTIIIALPFLLDRFFYRRTRGFIQCLIFPALLTSQDFLQSLPVGTGILSSLGLSQLDSTILTQASTLFGVFSVTFAAAFIGALLNWMQDQQWRWEKIRLPVVVAVCLVGMLWMYGDIRIKYKDMGETTRVAGIIARENDLRVDPAQKDRNYWKTKLSSEADVKYVLTRTKKAIDAGAKIIAWSEDYLFIDQKHQEVLLNDLSRMALDHQVYILPAYLLLKDTITTDHLLINKAVMINAKGEAVFHYIKSYPAIGSESMMIDQGNKIIPVTETEYGRIGAVICADMDYPQYIRQASAKKIDLLLVPGFDWKGISPYHTQVASVEAMQNGTALLRVCKNGLSAAYDSIGRRVGQLNDFTSMEDIFISDIPIKRSFTFYGAIGWVFPYVILGLAIGLFAWYLFLRMPKEIMNALNHRKRQKAAENGI
ncbi:MAG: hypothetical protein N2484_16635 [Clostridia bacterium]|nr:hypothetical protein [Clostridia bacterium]